MLDRVHAIQAAGLEVWCGMILGFDNDDATVFDAQREFLRDARITHAMVGMLTAIPKTPLYARLASEGRLDLEDVTEFGTNVIPLRMSRRGAAGRLCAGAEGSVRAGSVLRARGRSLPETRKRLSSPPCVDYHRRNPWRRAGDLVKDMSRAVGLFARLMSRVPEASLRREYRRRLAHLLRERPDPRLIFLYTVKCAMHYHHFTMARQMAGGHAALVNSF